MDTFALSLVTSSQSKRPTKSSEGGVKEVLRNSADAWTTAWCVHRRFLMWAVREMREESVLEDFFHRGKREVAYLMVRRLKDKAQTTKFHKPLIPDPWTKPPFSTVPYCKMTFVCDTQAIIFVFVLEGGHPLLRPVWDCFLCSTRFQRYVSVRFLR